MKHAKYNIFNEMEENEHVRVDGDDDGWRLRLYNLSNFVIDGENSLFFHHLENVRFCVLIIVMILKLEIW